ncbi:MAG TPA: DUF4340 domain-containing protein [Xanthobacteraceae bacterium]|jgi:hypothetical protein|nr:DUF4340 domain-containing protein [Xanthobacteraceae bacterium]
MNLKHLTTLAVLAAMSIAITAWVIRTSAPTVASDRRGENIAPSLLAKASDITGLSIRDGADTFVIERRDNRFVAADSGYPVKTDAVGDVIASSAGLTFEEARTSDPARYGDLGLADPGFKDAGKEVTFRTAGGELASLLVGNSDTTVGGPSGGVFIRLKGQPQTFLVRGSVRLPGGRSSWFVPMSFDVKLSEIKKVELTGGGRDGITLLPNTETRGQFVLADVPEKRTPENLKASLLANSVANFRFQDVRKATTPAADARRMVVEAGEGLQIVFTALGELTEGWVHITAEATNDAAKDKAKLITSKVEAYDFRLPSSEADHLGWTMTDLTVEQKG